jgi:short subunit dehydrogenase-like uncharacterized protein
MSTKPVVLYGASGYTGRLVAEYLREFNIPFVAAGRNAESIKNVMAHVPGIETANFEVVEVPHTVEALTQLFKGARVVCNMVGPFIKYGGEVVEAALAAGCHYIDTTGEQDWMRMVDEEYGERYAAKGLLVSPAVAHMYVVGDIASNICLETPGVDTLDTLTLWGGMPTYASMQSVFTILMADHFYLEQNEYVQWPAASSFNVAVPGQHQTAIAMPWGGTPHPVWHKRNPRVANVRSLGGVFNQMVMQGVQQIAKMVEEKIKPLPPAEQRKALSEQAAALQSGMPPRENHRINRTLDSTWATGPNRAVHCVIHGARNYHQTGYLQALAAHNLIRGRTRQAGFASACQAFGHRELLGGLQSYGFVGDPIVSGQVSQLPVPVFANTQGRLGG